MHYINANDGGDQGTTEAFDFCRIFRWIITDYAETADGIELGFKMQPHSADHL